MSTTAHPVHPVQAVLSRTLVGAAAGIGGGIARRSRGGHLNAVAATLELLRGDLGGRLLLVGHRAGGLLAALDQRGQPGYLAAHLLEHLPVGLPRHRDRLAGLRCAVPKRRRAALVSSTRVAAPSAELA
jgi:hypothetical protein